MKNSKKVWEILEGQENCNAFYIGGQESLLYGQPKDNKAIQTIQSNLGKHESIIQEFDRDGYDIGNVACIYLSGKPLEYALGVRKSSDLTNVQSDLFNTLSLEPQHTSYRKNWVACFDRLGKYKQKNGNSKQKKNGIIVDALQDGVALLQYTEQDREATEQQREQIETIYGLYTSMKGKTGKGKQLQKAKLVKAIKAVASNSIIGLASNSDVVTTRTRKKYSIVK